ncbi:MAG TPA: hypothetical protein VII95_18350 [Terriglobales bacterium]
MHSKQHVQNSLSRTWCIAMVALATAVAFGLMASVTQTAQAQTFTVIHAFTGGADGARPYAGPTMDLEGNLYGTDWAVVGPDTVRFTSSRRRTATGSSLPCTSSPEATMGQFH